MSRAPLTRQRVDLIIGTVLRYGVLTCAVVIALGLGLGVVRPHKAGATLGEILPQLTSAGMVDAAGPPRSATVYVSPGSYADPDVMVSLGIILLILLPVLRVGMTIIIFLLERDRVYVAITTFVFGVLLFGLLFGKAL